MVKHTSWHMPGISSSIKPEYGAAFQKWCNEPLGKSFIDLEQRRMNEFIATLFGYDALMLGDLAFAKCMEQSTIKNQYVVNDNLNLTGIEQGYLCSRCDRLPIANGVIDVVYLAHCLEYATNPHEVLREAYRVLRNDGHLIISMFNNMSAWGMWRVFGQYGNNILWKANFMSIVKLKDWLALLGFDIMRINYFGYNLPRNRCNYPNELSVIERYGQKLEIPIGAAYIIEASKRVIPLTPIVQTWANTPVLNEDDVTEPTA